MATVSTRPPRRREPRPIAAPAPTGVDVPAETASAPTVSFIEPARRHTLICEAAYFRAERRGFCPGQELDDWLAAESEIDRTLKPGTAGS
jgi:hypothetical protein